MTQLIRSAKPELIVETGVFRGDTTEWFARWVPIPVMGVEVNKRRWQFAALRLRRYGHVRVKCEDSRGFLQRLVADYGKKRVLVYLDAHWEADLPLWEELEIAVKGLANSVIVVDDFGVPWDSGYAFDDYGAAGTLEVSVLEQHMNLDGLGVFFPALRSEKESGAKRGCIVLTPSKEARSRIGALKVVRSYPTS